MNYKNVRSESIKAIRQQFDNVLITTREKTFRTYMKRLKQSTFTLSPRGYGPTSYRMFEALSVGSIPIYVWEDTKILPYSDEVDWDEFAVVLNRKELPQLKERLEGLNIKKMSRRGIEFYQEYCTLDATSNKIIEKLQGSLI